MPLHITPFLLDASIASGATFRELTMNMMDEINRRTWRKANSLRFYRRLDGHVDEGEKKIFEMIRALPSPPRVLDIGIGGGRTTALFRGLTRTYTGIDYTEKMVDLARTAHPGVTFRHMDARDLSAFADESFDLVMFSFNGIDSVDHAGRLRIIDEVRRVLAPHGLFVFSTFHSGWDGFRHRRHHRQIWSLDPIKVAARIVWYIGGRIRAVRLRGLEVRGDGFALLGHPAHDYGIMVHATTIGAIDRELTAAGFETPPQIFDEKGRAARDLSDLGSIEHFNVVATRSGDHRTAPTPATAAV